MRIWILVLVLCSLGLASASAQTHEQVSQIHEAAPLKPPVVTTSAVPQPTKTSVPAISSSQGSQQPSAAKPAMPDENGPQVAHGTVTAATTPAPREADAGKPGIKRLTPDEIEARLRALRDKVAMARANPPKPRPRPRAAVAAKPIPRPRFVVHWPDDRVTLSWPPPEERFSVSWPR